MTLAIALCIGGLVTAGVYLLLRRSVVKLLFGLVLLGHAANLLIFTLGGLVRARAPIVAVGHSVLDRGAADPVPQALVLTAIVIGFAIVAFLAVLIRRAEVELETSDVDILSKEEPEEAP